MKSMTRRGRTAVAVLLAALALSAMLPVPCACLPETAPAQAHGCCAGAYALTASAPGCCPAAEPGRQVPAAPPDAAALVPSLAFAHVSAVAASGETVVRGGAPEPLVSPPSTVRRL
jgi:hypothetical protein